MDLNRLSRVDVHSCKCMEYLGFGRFHTDKCKRRCASRDIHYTNSCVNETTQATVLKTRSGEAEGLTPTVECAFASFDAVSNKDGACNDACVYEDSPSFDSAGFLPSENTTRSE